MIRHTHPCVISMVTRYVGNRHLAIRYVSKAREGDALYRDICRTAFKRRHWRQHA
jgi:hypothetical protein